MVNRTGTYFAFDGLGQTNPSQSDFKYYTAVQGWAAGKSIEFKFVNSHDKASAVRDSSKLTTLQASIRLRLRASKNMVVILSDQTRQRGSLLSYEIEKAVDDFKLPLIIAHTGYNSILDPSALSDRWPETLRARITNRSAQAIHIPFRKNAILAAINQFTVNSNNLNIPLQYYSRDAHREWGYIE